MISGGDSACSLKRRITFLDRAEQIFVPRQRQIRIVAALQQQLHAADRDRLVDLAEQLVEAQDVAFRRSDGSIERAEVALRDADVRVVDVAVDDVGDDAVRMLARAHARRPARPSSDVGARRYSSSASAAFSRSPARTLSAMRSMVIVSPDQDAGPIRAGLRPRFRKTATDRPVRRRRFPTRSERTAPARRVRRRRACT